VDYGSRAVARILARTVLGVMASFSAARVLFQRDSFGADSRRTRSTWSWARTVTSSKLPSQEKFYSEPLLPITYAHPGEGVARPTFEAVALAAPRPGSQRSSHFFCPSLGFHSHMS
jgi:hypothetical protein